VNGQPTVRYAVRAGAYHDSLVLMRLQRALAELPGVLDAGVVMGTPANRELLAASGLSPGPETAAGPYDLLIAVKAESEAAAGAALARVDALLGDRRAGGGEEFRPRTLASAARQLPEARWALISLPGRHAAGVADEALDLGLNVFLYSDNVPVAEEVALKRKARERGLLLMGPDCGTAVVGGVGLGFANRVRRGPVGLVGASGTGLQAVMSHLHWCGQGISQALGTGGRDLSAEVGGIAAAQALDLLGRDPETRVIVLISKPPAPEVAVRLLALARGLAKPVVVYFLGAPSPGWRGGELFFAGSLSEAAQMAWAVTIGQDEGRRRAESGEGAIERDPQSESSPGALAPARPVAAVAPFAPGQRWVRGLFSGGTLAAEARLGLAAGLGTVDAGASLTRTSSSPDTGHMVADLGADEFTVGRLHPMIDFDLRLRLLRREAADPEVAMVLLDVVLGEGAHADPVGELAPAIEAAREEVRAAGRELEVAAVVIGTDEDPQGLARQIEALARAGAHVFRTMGDLVEHAVRRLGPSPHLAEPPGTPVPLSALQPPLAAINVGLESFYDSLLVQGASAIQVDWRPPAGGDEKLAAILARLKGR
jgi:FdrA protein